MVYCGKPSRGCQMCRTRRIKCDEAKPTCNQCAKSRRHCPGYKDEFDLVFRNETQATERRARKATKKFTAQRLYTETELIAAGDPTSMLSPESLSQSPTSSLMLPVDQQASCHFVANYVLIPRQGSARGFMEYLIPLLRADSPAQHLKLAFDACALASLGNRVGPGNDFENMALTKYTKALSSTYAALRDQDTAKQDSTLAAILLLGLFENISAKQLGMLAWGSHIEGAIHLVKARGRKQLRTKTGLLLFIAVRTQMIIHSLSSGTPPAMGVEWWINDAVQDKSAAACQRLNITVGELRSEVNRLLASLPRSPENVELLADMIRRCQNVDQECVNWSRNLPPDFQYKTVAWEDNVHNGDFTQAEVFPGRVDAYQDLWIASIWNMSRCSRIILASLIVRCAAWICAPVDYRTTPEYATAARTCVEIINDIVASVPYQLGWFATRKNLLERAHLSTFGCGDEDALKGLPGYFLTWPLTCVLGQDYTSDSQRAWVKGRLRFIGSHLGIRYAHMLTQLNLRIPSMLIRQDGLMAKPYPSGHNFEKLLSNKSTTAARQTGSGRQSSVSQQRRAQNKNHTELKNAMSSQVDEWTMRTYLEKQEEYSTAAMSDSQSPETDTPMSTPTSATTAGS